MRRARRSATSWALTAALGAVPVAALPHGAAGEVFRCRNPSSGAAWQITIDRARATVDSYAAAITERHAAWHDTAQGGYYDLDLQTGALTVRQASSTGGYFLHDRCRPAAP